MLTISATDAKRAFATVLKSTAREPVLIQKQRRDVAVLLSIADYERLTRANVQAFQPFCDPVGAKAEQRGLTEEKLAELLSDKYCAPFPQPRTPDSRWPIEAMAPIG